MEQMNPSNIGVLIEAGTKDFVEKCTNCGECLRVCPVFPLTKFADMGPEAMMEKVIELLKGDDASEEACDMVWSCNGGCNRCVEACPQELRLDAALVAFARAKLFTAGKEPPHEMYVRMAGHRCSMGNVFPALQVKPSEERWVKRVPENPEPVDVVIYPSCSGMVLPHVLLDIEDIMGRMGVSSVTLQGGDICCGSSGLILGDLEAAQRFNQAWASAITAFNPKKALMCCFGCEVTSKGGLFPPLAVEGQWVLEFLVENMDRIPFTQKLNKVVTVYDSCDAGVSRRWDLSRKLLGAIPGITLVEMAHNKENYVCCGGITGITRPDIAESIHRAILQEGEDTSADVMVTTCSGCQRFLVPLDHQYSVEVRNIIGLVAEACGVHHENRFRKYSRCSNLDEVLTGSRDCIDAGEYSLEEMGQILPDHLSVLLRTQRDS